MVQNAVLLPSVGNEIEESRPFAELEEDGAEVPDVDVGVPRRADQGLWSAQTDRLYGFCPMPIRPVGRAPVVENDFEIQQAFSLFAPFVMQAQGWDFPGLSLIVAGRVGRLLQVDSDS